MSVTFLWFILWKIITCDIIGSSLNCTFKYLMTKSAVLENCKYSVLEMYTFWEHQPQI